MRIGGVLCVKDEEETIERHVRYHLEVQGFDTILIIDNASHDQTFEVLRGMKDDRLILRRTHWKDGFVQDYATTVAANELFNKYECDWVFPIDGDEYWHSEKFGSVKKAVEKIPRDYGIYHTHAYDFVLTVRDDAREEDFLKRLQYASLFEHTKVVLYRMHDKFQLLEIGNHNVHLKPGEERQEITLPSDVLLRYHYRYISPSQVMKKILNKAEGYIIRTKGEWAYENIPAGTHVRKVYNEIKAGRFDEWYQKLIKTKNQLEKGLEKGRLVHITTMKELAKNF